MAQRIFGSIPGVAVGAAFANRKTLAKSGVHRPTQAGISGSASDGGADPIAVSGGYEDDSDFGDEIIYTGHGGRDSGTGKQIADQELSRGNLALQHNLSSGQPVRVVRGANSGSPFAPKAGFRYDGLYTVDDCWQEKGKSGYRIIRYRLLRLSAEMTPMSTTEPSLGDPPLGSPSPTRQRSSVTRVVRDTAVSRHVKALHKYECQVCGTTLDTPAGKYAEAAHIKPLGEPHNGPDTPDNILCLCPNCHVLFDRGAIAVADDLSLIGIDGDLKQLDDHTISSEYLKYHRDHYGS